MSNRKVLEATLPGYHGPFFLPCLEKLQQVFYGEKSIPCSGRDLEEFASSIEGYTQQNRPCTEDGYQWFWALEFRVGPSKIAILFPLSWDDQKTDGTSADRHIALYDVGQPTIRTVEQIVETLTLSAELGLRAKKSAAAKEAAPQT